jgi:hypothetical protein
MIAAHSRDYSPISASDDGAQMASIYDLLRQRCGLSQQEAANFHETRIDTVKSWCSDRRTAPIGVLDELRDLYSDIVEAADELVHLVQLVPQFDEKGDRFFRVGLPLDDRDAVVCGFPTVSTCQAAVAIAVASLSKNVPVELVPRERGSIPTAVTQKRGQRRVTVYHFKVWDAQSGQYIVPERKSPLERIKSIGGEALIDTAERVDESALDAHGRYSVKARNTVTNTGWSARANEIARRHGLENWTSAKPSELKIDSVPRIAFTFADGKEVHFDAGIGLRLSRELRDAGEVAALKMIDTILGQLGLPQSS